MAVHGERSLGLRTGLVLLLSAQEILGSGNVLEVGRIPIRLPGALQGAQIQREAHHAHPGNGGRDPAAENQEGGGRAPEDGGTLSGGIAPRGRPQRGSDVPFLQGRVQPDAGLHHRRTALLHAEKQGQAPVPGG
ncbi:hypothetical protein BVU_3376 [Phocaeicola vulgatus ATCC 8482]|uniref:Uncharacterized protein n=1 Tax=Phocaeicola vulgatus (strain ATCC 8482 / DSM 1447 / JCM 5826 / CCUG 4940 / NBRC 14291 / NCTC 11154) TaxID=435590 RepID=A6L5N8_PHOV8|nr:hypothetical protein BVU_3376 [Phocaeicola vulgatus ATCC 8482]